MAKRDAKDRSSVAVDWNFIRERCGLCGGEMVLQEGGEFGPFYRCENYPLDLSTAERPCYNRMSTQMHEEILTHIEEQIDELVEQGVDQVRLTGHRWQYRKGVTKFQFRVFSHRADQVIVDVVNETKGKAPWPKPPKTH